MTRSERLIDEYSNRIAVMTAFSNGCKIEKRKRLSNKSEGWEIVAEPSWDWDVVQYRIYREPREVWVNHYDKMYYLHKSAYSAKKQLQHGGKTVKYREVIEED